MLPTLRQYQYRVAHDLYVLYDHGGLSRRAIRSQILETLWKLERLPDADIHIALQFPMTAETLDPGYAQSVRSQERHEELQYLLFPDIALMDDESYACVAIAAIEMTNATFPEYVSLYETVLLKALGTAYGLYEAESYYRALASNSTPEKLLAAAWRRNWIWDSEFGCAV